MNLFRKIILRFDRSFLRLRTWIWRRKAAWQAWVNGGNASLIKCSVEAPLRINGRGTVILDDTTIGYRLGPRVGNGESVLQARREKSLIKIGKNTNINNNLTIICNEKVEIGCDCLIGEEVKIYDSDFHGIHPENRRGNKGKIASVTIGNNVWIGSRAIILKGVQIGTGSIIGAASVVTSDVPENVIFAGSPARLVQHLVSNDPSKGSIE